MSFSVCGRRLLCRHLHLCDHLVLQNEELLKDSALDSWVKTQSMFKGLRCEMFHLLLLVSLQQSAQLVMV